MTNWDEVDWTKQDAVLARELDVSREWVRRNRERRNMPKSPRHQKRTFETVEAQILKAFKPSMTCEDIAKQVGTSRDYVYITLHSHGLKAKTKPAFKYDWVNVDWAKLNTQIASELGVSEPYVAKFRKRFAPDEYKRSPYFRRAA